MLSPTLRYLGDNIYNQSFSNYDTKTPNKNIGRKALKNFYSLLLESDEILSDWNNFQRCAVADFNSAAPVAEYAFLLNKIRSSHVIHNDHNSIKVLNHGAGSELPELYWIANGFKDIKSVDIFSEGRSQLYKKLNQILINVTEIEEDIFHIYDGLHLPFNDSMFDFINSNAVVEHLSDKHYFQYFKEQARVLKVGGKAIYVIPQRLQPYDSHNQTWFLHYLPSKFHAPLNKRFGRYNADLTLVLRSKFTHLRYITKVIGPCSDHSIR